jgi:hypothetical protein
MLVVGHLYFVEYCSCKHKFGLDVQAIYNDELQFTWIDFSWPGSTADYMAWITSSLCLDIEHFKDTISPIIKKGFTLVGDNAYVKTEYM